MKLIKDYSQIVGKEIIDELYLVADKLKGKKIQNINSTLSGGGVAEILSRMIPLMKDLGLDVGWDVLDADNKFFEITKKIHNALHGLGVDINEEEYDYFLQVNKANKDKILDQSDIVYIHDPQPIALIDQDRDQGKKWLWRCHVDFSKPKENVWEFLKAFIKKYQAAVFSAPAFARFLDCRQILISPSIDPLSDKNRNLEKREIDFVLEKYGIDPDKPIITQISRFDHLKDPLGVIESYRLVKKYIDCQLILAGGGASDDPQTAEVLKEAENLASADKDIFVLHLPSQSNLEINALQRASTVILQKSLKEGFGLTVCEALWKQKPVIASAVGGIPLQIAHKYSGILTYTTEGTAYWIKQLIQEPEYAKRLGDHGKKHVANNFLITRQIQDYLLLFLSLYNKSDIVDLG
ncbi:MAG: glycosyltransferase [Candidatus Omnitrophica bacterium]|nr:glycosyltransferase [Candidatus Omnitrophota bacterium]MCF7877059.1 glycosyltransferase [Candidatus Omnitrophota bacterium]MCF7891650.1 glycosyltransferase [Candidatus Omnitrophota bacterium]MCF7895982.1 glycosyltransferase [Candidatus Omnitrophota bacterium]MCF7897271.1 glycosyltransferase [Candidatus Omnitrophota bacterium]